MRTFRRACPTCRGALAEVDPHEHPAGLACPICGPVDRWAVLDDAGRLVAVGTLDGAVLLPGWNVSPLILASVRYAAPVDRGRRVRAAPRADVPGLAAVLRASGERHPWRDFGGYARRVA